MGNPLAATCLVLLFSTAALAQGGVERDRKAATLPPGSRTTAFAFAPGGGSVAYAVPAPDGGVTIHRDGEELGRFEAVHSLSFGADGRALAFAAREEGRFFVVLGSDRWGPYDAVQEGSLAVSPYGNRVAYVALAPGTGLFADGTRLVEAEQIGTPRWSHGGAALDVGLRVGNELWWRTVAVPRKAGEPTPAERYKTVLLAYYEINFECVKAGGGAFNADRAWDEAARSGGFEDKKAFDAWVARIAQSGDPSSLAEAAKEAAEGYSRRIQAWSREQAEKAAAGEGEKEEPPLDHVVRQPDANYPDDDLIVWKDPGRNRRAFLLSPGTPVAVVESVDGEEFGSPHLMLRIRTADGREGWIPDRFVVKKE